MAVLKYKDDQGNWHISNSLPLTLHGTTDPTTATRAHYIGQIYLNTASGKVFICKAISGSTYTWIELATQSSITDAIEGSY